MSLTSLPALESPAAPASPGPPFAGRRWHREVSGRDAAVVGLLVLVTGLARLPLLRAPLGSDEGGLLLLAGQWHPGSSLYGNYWVDRPPLLVALFALADGLGGVLPLRILGVVLVIGSVLAAGRIGSLAHSTPGAPRTSDPFTGGVVAAATAAIFLAGPLFGAQEVDGELVSVPFILGSIVMALSALGAPGSTRRRVLLLGAGALATAAVLIKQNQVDAFVFLAVLVAVDRHGARRGERGRPLLMDLAAVAVGSATVAALLLWVAVRRGTTLAGLWAALVTFRVDASMVISSSASPATADRLRTILEVAALSGAPAIVLLVIGHGLLTRRRATASSRPVSGVPGLGWATLAVLAWEMFSVLGGGSYWLHYLICLVPGLVLAAGSIPPLRPPGHLHADLRVMVLGYCALVAAVALGSTVARSGHASADDLTASWLSAHARPHDTAVVAYGQPNILYEAGLTSPYPELWSLPARVRDPNLVLLGRVLGGPDRPSWVISGPDGLATWGVDATSATTELTAHYKPVADIAGRVIYRQRLPHLS